MARSIRMAIEPVRFLAAADIAATYRPLNKTGGTTTADFETGYLDHPARYFFLQNLTDGTLWFSIDGSTNHFPLPPNGFFLNDVTSNQISDLNGLFMSEGEAFWVKQLDVPTTGAVYFTAFYGRGE